jgi:hypothetical protein
MERFSLKKLSDVEGRKQYHFEVSKRFATLEDLDGLGRISKCQSKRV